MKRLTKLVSVMMAVVMILGILPQFVVSAAYENTHVNTGNQAYDIVEVAKTQIGYTEGSNNDTKYNRWFGRLTGFPSDGYGYAWCQTFVAWCANQAGISTSDIPRVSGTISAKQTFINNGTYHTGPYEGGSYTPKKGDIIYFYSSATDSKHHVGIVSDCVGGIVYTIEGNSSNKVQTCSYSVTNSKIRGYGVPNYSGTVVESLIELNVTVGTKTSKTTFNWVANNSSFDAYDVKIWNGTYWVGDTYHTEWGITGNEFQIDLPAGYYEAYVDARFGDNIVMSNVVTFTVEEDYFGQPSLSVTAGGKKSKTEFTWTEVEKADVYHVKIWNGTCWEGDIYHSGWGLTGTSYEVDLPPGYYEAYVDAANDETYQMSNVVTFTVEEDYFGQPSLSVTAGGKKSKTEFTWTEVEKANVYHVKIWNGTCGEGDIYHSGWGLTGTSYEVDLPPGYYEAYVDAANDETYQMSNIVSFTVEEEYNPADINQDSQTSVLDVVLLQKYILNLREFTPLQFTTADLNSDGAVDAFDLALLKQLLLDK